MTAYVIFTRERLRDEAEFEVYKPLAGASIEGHDAQVLVYYGAHETLEGAPIAGVVMVQFPDIDAAKAWYHGPAYQEAVKHRFLAGDYRAFITEGVSV